MTAGTAPPKVWGYVGYIPHEADDDAPVRDALIAQMIRSGVESAAAQGVVLDGIEPSVEQCETVIVPDWSEQGDGIVSADIATLAGIDPATCKRGPNIARIAWTIA